MNKIIILILFPILLFAQTTVYRYGDQVASGGTTSHAANFLYYHGILVEHEIVLDSAWIRVTTSAPPSMKCAVYSMNPANHALPSALLDTCTERTDLTTINTWYVFKFLNSKTISAGDTIFLTFWSDSVWRQSRIDTDGNDNTGLYGNDANTYGIWPNPIVPTADNQYENVDCYIVGYYTVTASETNRIFKKYGSYSGFKK